MFPLNPEADIHLQAEDARRALEHARHRAGRKAQREPAHRRRTR